MGISWQSSSQDLVLSLSGALVRSQVGELRFPQASYHGQKEKKKKRNKKAGPDLEFLLYELKFPIPILILMLLICGPQI